MTNRTVNPDPNCHTCRGTGIDTDETYDRETSEIYYTDVPCPCTYRGNPSGFIGALLFRESDGVALGFTNDGVDVE